ncbi:MAG: DUF362 domain-containing protein [Clostridia bacterium]|nr:DUF362 domain-containing protein [Clostridia bacterium]
MKSKVYFTRKITPESVCRLYEAVGRPLTGRVAVKVHSGERGNQNFIRPDFWEPMIRAVRGTVVETNTAYKGARRITSDHAELLRSHGWSPLFNTLILDGEGADTVLEIPKGKIIKKNYVGNKIADFDSLLVLSHFKGHPMGGFGGAIKQLSIGMASSFGKQYIHGAGDPELFWDADHDSFLEAMADAASSVVELFGENVVYINVMKNMSVDCDCCAKAEDPCMKDIGILASTDPVAIDRACLDLVYGADDPGKDHLIRRIESRNGAHTVEAAEALGIGSVHYVLTELD